MTKRAYAPIGIGIMSGTSVDGIDIAIARLGQRVELLKFKEFPLPSSLRQRILELATSDHIDVRELGQVDRLLGQAYADATLQAIAQSGLNIAQIDLIGCHGQTIHHSPDSSPPFTLQIGCAATLAENTTITTVSDFRSRDIAAGGQGAPLVPYAHQQLLPQSMREKAVAFLNIGGIANISWLKMGHPTIGFDSGPGNIIMDQLITAISHGKTHFDSNGTLAASGNICIPLLQQLMQHPFLQQQPPKSTGREQFGTHMVQKILQWPAISDADRMATACQYTVETIAESIAYLPEAPGTWLLCGGGCRNQHLLQQLQQRLTPATVNTTEHIGINPQAVESLSFALLARQTILGESNTLADVTGANHAVSGGQITPGKNWAHLMKKVMLSGMQR